MRIIEPVSVDAMIAAFLQAEINSPRFQDSLLRLLGIDHQDRDILQRPDVDCPAENAYRAQLLGEWRGYGQNSDVFTDLPDDTRWVRAVLDRSDLYQVKYIQYDYWTEFSGGSRFVHDAVTRIRNEAIDREDAACYHLLAKTMGEGAPFPELILLYNPRTEEIVVMEGHVRLTSYLLWAEEQPVELTVILGISDRMQK